jgi:hypothetical protein
MTRVSALRPMAMAPVCGCLSFLVSLNFWFGSVFVFFVFGFFPLLLLTFLHASHVLDVRRAPVDSSSSKQIVLELKLLRLLRARDEGRLSEGDYERRRAAVDSMLQ